MCFRFPSRDGSSTGGTRCGVDRRLHPGTNVQRWVTKDGTRTPYIVRRPRLRTCGQWSHAFSKKGLVTPRSKPALGGNLFTSSEWSPSCIVKYGLISPANGIFEGISTLYTMEIRNVQAVEDPGATKLPDWFALGTHQKLVGARLGPNIPRLTINLIATTQTTVRVAG